VTLQLLWEEYRQGNPEGYRYSRFCELYQRWRSKLDVVLRQELLEAPSEGAILAPYPFAPLSLLLHRLRTVLAVKGSLRRAQQRRALDRSGPF